MSENWKIQVSPKLADGTLINLRAENPHEAEQILKWATENAVLITSTAQSFVATATVAAALPVQYAHSDGPSWSQQGTQQQYAQAATQGAPQQAQFVTQAPQQAPAGQSCSHGAMTFRSGIGKASGKPYKAFFCPAAKGDPTQCDAVFVRD